MSFTRYLDSLARWILAACEYRVLGIIILFILVGFCSWRRYRYKLWPTPEDYYQLAMGLIGTIGGLSAALTNKINSIAKTNPIYKQAVEFGKQLLGLSTGKPEI